MTAFIISMLVGMLLGQLGLTVSWIVGGMAVAATALCAMLFPLHSPIDIWLALAIGIVGYNVGLMLALASRFRRAANHAEEAS